MKRQTDEFSDLPPALVVVLVAFILAMLLTGCGTAPRGVQTVKVAIPTKCKAEVPSRPAMPTENIQIEPLDTFNHRFTASAIAEIEIREGYEVRLATELQSCL